MGVGSLVELVHLFYKVNLLPDLGISSSGCIDAGIYRFVVIRLCLLCLVLYSL